MRVSSSPTTSPWPASGCARCSRPRTGSSSSAECQTGTEAIDAIGRLEPDLVFLDVQMPGASGFEVIEAVGAARMPLVVFVTAFDIRAARRSTSTRSTTCSSRSTASDSTRRSCAPASSSNAPSNGDLERRLLELVQDLKPARQRLERFVIKSGGRVFFVRADEIDWIEAAGNYVKLHVGTETHLFRETMNAIEAQLDPDTFFRIHRSHIVNIERVKELQPWFNGEYVVFLRNGTRLTLSRSYRDKLQDRSGGLYSSNFKLPAPARKELEPLTQRSWR